MTKEEIKEYHAKYYRDNREKFYEYNRNRFKNHREDMLDYQRKLYEKNKDLPEFKVRRAKIVKKYRDKPSSKKSAAYRARNYSRKYREEAIELLGCKCTMCGNDDFRVLQFDHINGGGTKDSRTRTKIWNKEVLDRIRNGYEGFQLLCANCNWIKKYENKENRSVYKYDI